jgi:hypothetical protein
MRPLHKPYAVHKKIRRGGNYRERNERKEGAASDFRMYVGRHSR